MSNARWHILKFALLISCTSTVRKHSLIDLSATAGLCALGGRCFCVVSNGLWDQWFSHVRSSFLLIFGALGFVGAGEA